MTVEEMGQPLSPKESPDDNAKRSYKAEKTTSIH